MPVWTEMHLYFKSPPNIWRPAMAKMMKKKSKIMRVSLNKGSASIKASIKTLRPLILEMVLRGLKTLKTLSPEVLN
jgi:hypothetical protein